ncbi:hypothetical protein JHK86_000750 [Glycine max]|nr:hypothetical protein JHK86_000750 [Glycine max]
MQDMAAHSACDFGGGKAEKLVLVKYRQEAHRAYMNLKTIRPNMRLLGQLFQNKSIGSSEFQLAVLDGHKNRQGQTRDGIH